MPIVVQLLAEKGRYHPASVSSKVGGMYFLYVAKAGLKDPKEADLVVKYAGKADKSLKDRLDNHGHGMTQMTLCPKAHCTLRQRKHSQKVTDQSHCTTATILSVIRLFHCRALCFNCCLDCGYELTDA